MATISRIAITPGEPAGIGPDLCIALAQQAHEAELVLLADPKLLEQRAAQLGLPLILREFNPQARPQPQTAGQIAIVPITLAQAAQCGQLNVANAPYVLAGLRRAVQGCLAVEFAALVTGPVHKGIINQAGIPFTGHTEYLAEQCGGTIPVMMLVAPGLRVALATTHLPLAKVSAAITPSWLQQVLQILHHDLQQRFGIAQPRILVCGLNPHAGEGGHLGREELEIIEPVLAELRATGLHLEGPLSADTVFTPPNLAGADAVLAMYHDQGLPVLKHIGFGQAVNVTLGLPIIRTSVDHGTALELAGTGQARIGSLEAALQMALSLASSTEAHEAMNPGRILI